MRGHEACIFVDAGDAAVAARERIAAARVRGELRGQLQRAAEGQAIGAKVGSYQTPANKTFKADPRIPSIDSVKLIKYDFEKYGKSAERRRLIDRWTKEVEPLPR